MTLLNKDLSSLLGHISLAADNSDASGVSKWMSELKHLTASEQTIVLDILKDLKTKGHSAMADALWQVDFERKPVTISQFLSDPYYFGKVSIYPVWKKELEYVLGPNSNIVEWMFCLQGDTPIPLLDGRVVPIKELAGSDPVNLYSYDERRNLTVGRAWNIRKTGEDQIVRITLDDGTYVETNPRHELVLLNNRKRRVQDLKVGDRLAPFYRRPSGSDWLHGYEEIYHPGSRGWGYTHHMSANWKYGRSGLVANGRTCHKNFSLNNNDPSNLILKSSICTLNEPRLDIVVFNDLSYSSIISIEYTGRVEDVYCMTVDRYHNFAILGRDSEGKAVHNSGIISGNTGAIGVGKTYIALVAQAYKLYWMSCLRCPQTYYGLDASSEIVFGMFNTTKDNASLVDYGQMMKFIDTCPYFKEIFPRRPIKKFIHFEQKDIFFNLGSSELHALGQNLFGYLMDEVNFMRTKDDVSQGQAHQIYHHARRRQRSRFEQYGSVPGLCCIISSRKSQSSFLEGLMSDMKDDPTVHISDYALWEVKGRHLYSEKTFRIVIGDRYRSSEILDELDPKDHSIISSKEAQPGQDIMEIPANFYMDFRRDPAGSLRDIAGVATFAIQPLIRRVEAIRECIDETRSHPAISESCELALNDEGADLLQYIKWDELTKIRRGSRMMKVRPGEPRYVHVDLALKGDCAGIAMAHAYDYYTRSEYDPITGHVVEHFHPKVYVDFIIRIKPTSGSEIDIAKIVAFIINLRNYGVPLERVTFDGFQSAMAIQLIQKAGQLSTKYRSKATDGRMNFTSGLLSMDRTDVPYTILRDSINYGAISYYEYEPFIEELTNLQHDIEKGKVDHQEGGGKDCCDAICGAVFNSITHYQTIGTTPESLINNSNKDLYNLDAGLTGSLLADYDDKDSLVGIDPAPVEDSTNSVNRPLGNMGSLEREIMKQLGNKK